jgi:LCP family protein required for cell wall assembly
VLLIVALGAVALTAGGSDTLSRLLDSRILIALIVLDVALLGWRLVAILQAHSERSALTLRSWPGWLTAGLVLVTVAMHALPAYYATKAIDTLGSVALEGGGGLGGRQEGRSIDVAPPSNQPEVELGERVTVLLVGVDFAPGRIQHLTDTMLVATLDPRTGEGAMISVPRDLYGVPLGDGRVYNAKLNSLMAAATDDPATYPEGGPATLKAAIGTLLGTEIHYFAAIDIEGMRHLIDTVHGIDLTVERAISDPQYQDPFTLEQGFSIQPGQHHLDGDTALAYVRSRMGEGDNDFTRAERQQQVLTAIRSAALSPGTFFRLPWVSWSAPKTLKTDMGGFQLMALFADMATGNSSDTEVLETTCCNGTNLFVSDGSKQDAVRKLLEGS